MEERGVQHLQSDALKFHRSWLQNTKLTVKIPATRNVNDGIQPSVESGHDGEALVHHCRSNTDINTDTQAIYCHGPLLHEAQLSKVHDDSKTFVDMKMKFDSGEILRKARILVEELLNLSGASKLSKLRDFITENLSPVSTDGGLLKCTPIEWRERRGKNYTPQFLESVKDSNLKIWGGKLNLLWKKLCRKIDAEVCENSDRHSLIYCSNPFIIPGGRFREFYYWDNYWINRGLLLCEMHETVKGMIRNFFEMVETFGFVPNGGRIYYTGRSQPPFLSLMVRDYVEQTGDQDFIREALPYLEKEYLFWDKHRTVDIEDCDERIHRLSRYACEKNQPRPESYKEDFELIHQDGIEKGEQYDGSRGHEVLVKLRTRDIIPVDLNAILSVVERNLAEFHAIVGNDRRSAMFRDKYERRIEAMEMFLWNENDGCYYDYVMATKSQNMQYFISNVTPLWTKSYPDDIDVAKRETAIFNYLKCQAHEGTPLLDFPGGIPVSLNDSEQQWDFPNAWPPCSHMVIEGMHTSDVAELQEEGFRQAQKYVKTCWNGFTKSQTQNAMFEKYNVLKDDGLPGNGGEYDVQEGFGWTNGVAISLLDAFGERLAS